MHVVVGVPVYGQLELALRALAAIDGRTPPEVDLIVVDDRGPQRLDEAMVASVIGSARRWRLVSHQHNRGFVGSVNTLFELAGGADVIVVNSDVEVLSGWFGALEQSVAGSERVASASSLADRGGLLSLVELQSLDVTDELLVRLRASSPVAAPVPVAVAHCTWFTRVAIDAVGGFDQAFAPGYGEEVDWSLRAARAGFVHLAALHSVVRHAGGASFGQQGGLLSLQRRHEVKLLLRYPRRWLGIRRFAADRGTEFAVAVQQIRLTLQAVAAEQARRR